MEITLRTCTRTRDDSRLVVPVRNHRNAEALYRAGLSGSGNLVHGHIVELRNDAFVRSPIPTGGRETSNSETTRLRLMRMPHVFPHPCLNVGVGNKPGDLERRKATQYRGQSLTLFVVRMAAFELVPGYPGNVRRSLIFPSGFAHTMVKVAIDLPARLCLREIPNARRRREQGGSHGNVKICGERKPIGPHAHDASHGRRTATGRCH